MTRTGDMKTEPGMLMRRMFRDLDPLFESRGWPFASLRKPLTDFPWMPELEMKEKDGYLTVKLDLPGVKKEEVAITVEEGMLTIEGERKREEETRKEEWFTTERTYGRFFRSIPLAEGVKAEDVKATFTNGVLMVTVHLPAAAAAPAPRKVPIEEGADKKAAKAAA